MIWIILATGFGAANFIVIALLFRRVRLNTRQLRDMRAERNSEWILHALQGVPDERVQPARVAVSGGHTPPLTPRPDRRKKHLGLYRGGAIAAVPVVLGAAFRCAREAHTSHIASVTIGTTAAAATAVTAMTVVPWQQDIDAARPATPATASATRTPDSAPPASTAAPAEPGRTPAVTSASPTTIPSASPDAASAARPTTAQPSPDTTGGPGAGDEAGAETPAPGSATAVPPTATQDQTCVTVLSAVLHACLAAGGG